MDDPKFVRRSYANSDKLEVRIRTHRLYTEPAVDFGAWVLDRIAWRGDERVVDVGCGTGGARAGVEQRARRYLGGDLSAGMRPDVRLDATRLPLRDGCADVVLANHMLYHVSDRAAAIAEIRRVLRPGGALIAATNGIDTMAELYDVMAHAGLTDPPPAPSVLFSLEGGAALLAEQFASVETHALTTALAFPDAEPAVAYVDSMRDLYEPCLDRAWPAFLDGVRAAIGDGPFRVRKTTGAFVCR